MSTSVGNNYSSLILKKMLDLCYAFILKERSNKNISMGFNNAG